MPLEPPVPRPRAARSRSPTTPPPHSPLVAATPTARPGRGRHARIRAEAVSGARDPGERALSRRIHACGAGEELDLHGRRHQRVHEAGRHGDERHQAGRHGRAHQGRLRDPVAAPGAVRRERGTERPRQDDERADPQQTDRRLRVDTAPGEVGVALELLEQRLPRDSDGEQDDEPRAAVTPLGPSAARRRTSRGRREGACWGAVDPCPHEVEGVEGVEGAGAEDAGDAAAGGRDAAGASARPSGADPGRPPGSGPCRHPRGLPHRRPANQSREGPDQRTRRRGRPPGRPARRRRPSSRGRRRPRPGEPDPRAPVALSTYTPRTTGRPPPPRRPGSAAEDPDHLRCRGRAPRPVSRALVDGRGRRPSGAPIASKNDDQQRRRPTASPAAIVTWLGRGPGSRSWAHSTRRPPRRRAPRVSRPARVTRPDARPP